VTTPGFFLQAAAEYGGAAGAQGSRAFGPGSGDLLDQGWTMLVDNPAVAVIGVVTVLFMIGLFRTGRYRA